MTVDLRNRSYPGLGAFELPSIVSGLSWSEWALIGVGTVLFLSFVTRKTTQAVSRATAPIKKYRRKRSKRLQAKQRYREELQRIG